MPRCHQAHRPLAARVSNVTVDGGGACFVTHGEMSFIVVDECDSIVLKNFSLKAADPTVAEMTVVAAGPRWMDVRPAADSRFNLSGGRLAWVGEGWRFDGGVAQVYYPRRNVTERCPSPLEGLVGARQLAGGVVRLSYRDSVWQGPAMCSRCAMPYATRCAD